jgi:hypothetical protein
VIEPRRRARVFALRVLDVLNEAALQRLDVHRKFVHRDIEFR